MAHRAPRPSDTGAGAGRQPREGGVTMLMARASKTEGRGGSQRRLDEGGRYLGIPQNGGLAAPRTGSDDADAHNSGLLSVQETGCGTICRTSPFLASLVLAVKSLIAIRPADRPLRGSLPLRCPSSGGLPYARK